MDNVGQALATVSSTNSISHNDLYYLCISLAGQAPWSLQDLTLLPQQSLKNGFVLLKRKSPTTYYRPKLFFQSSHKHPCKLEYDSMSPLRLVFAASSPFSPGQNSCIMDQQGADWGQQMERDEAESFPGVQKVVQVLAQHTCFRKGDQQEKHKQSSQFHNILFF